MTFWLAETPHVIASLEPSIGPNALRLKEKEVNIVTAWTGMIWTYNPVSRNNDNSPVSALTTSYILHLESWDQTALVII